ncbi:Aldehyde oxidase GLOX [Camellia lanceoleosa]|uniref:Aldehyde oxidase GLOX n=1 Tax=Camellia lanceoleosa TaxID=1840588 RepID=A0ACC0IHR7_9ERIC|nr:Aldehyde oxidase GLOX [Camellia lanceoleosa]
MSPSTRPRMYHSSDVLLTDGRVLVGGSNPHPYYNFTGVQYPTDLSLEAYSPPYLRPEYDPIPHPYYNFTGVQYPTDLSLEAYSPPYLRPEYDPIRQL